MKLLIITQKVDIDDDVKGFFHRWIEKLRQESGSLNVICLQSGRHFLPSDVTIWSLGKERNASKIRQLRQFYRYIWQLRNDYDVVFVHMNPIYVVLGGIFWKMQKKEIFLWYNHKIGGFIARSAIKMSHLVFYTSPFAFSAHFKNSQIMPVGIDTDIFQRKLAVSKKNNYILSLGRIAPVKKLEVLIEAAKILDQEGVNFVLDIVGDKENEADDYFEKIKNLAGELGERGKIRFLGKIPNYQTPEIYNQYEIFVNLTPAGSFDKTILEAMACQVAPILFNKSLTKDLPEFLVLKELNSRELKDRIVEIFNMSEQVKEEMFIKLRNFVIQNHNLDALIKRLLFYFNEIKS